MPSLLRRDDLSVIGRLLDAPQHFTCFQALRLLQTWLAEHGVDEATTLAEIVRFENSVSLSFPASQIEALATEGLDDADTVLQALLSGQLQHIRITPTFMGFLGSHGVLPSHYSERIAAHQHSKHDSSPRAFLDLFSSRAIALFFQAWQKYRIEHGPLRDKLLPQLLALAGCYGNEHGNSSAIGLYSGLLQQKNISSIIMARILSAHFGVPFQVAESTGGMEAMAPREQTTLGGANAMLSQRAIVGERCRRPDLAARLRIGPLTAQQHAAFLPGAPNSVQLQNMLRLFGQPLLRYDIVLVLRACEVQQLSLSSTGESRLGYDSFLGLQAAQQPRDDMHYVLPLMAPLNG
ncbi:type VI secretion system baseplate subunit TssG [Janthinobacterium sp.]|uniref:type VI secretion system baseplate subunit TssG n=1 Tax=Janthinobacterium sp. TaxID=1871054 RepID=UPI00260FB169|nr:type VI secretion system baseplate subunit TssG [Janthinobacterium sp.]